MFFFLETPHKSTITGFTFEHIKSHRLVKGDRFTATDLQGTVYKCELSFFDKKAQKADFKILEQQSTQSTLQDTLVQAVPDKNYIDKLVEVATLAGFNQIIFFESKFRPNY